MKIFITGASGGFGRLSTLALLEKGHQVVGTMRSTGGKNQEIAKELSDAGAHLVEMDVTKDDSVKAGMAQTRELLGGLDVVINNAGLGVSGMQEHFTVEDMKYLFDVNVFGVQRVLREAIPHFRAQQKGLILYVSSLLGRITLPFYGPYNASKWALEALAENYRTELSTFGIESSIIEPGGFPTTFFEALMTPSDTSRAEAYGEFMNVPKVMSSSFGEALANNPLQKPEKVAEAIVNVIEMPYGQKPMRTVVDHMGMGDPIVGYNKQLDQMTQGIYASFGIEGMLSVNS